MSSHRSGTAWSSAIDFQNNRYDSLPLLFVSSPNARLRNPRNTVYAAARQILFLYTNARHGQNSTSRGKSRIDRASKRGRGRKFGNDPGKESIFLPLCDSISPGRRQAKGEGAPCATTMHARLKYNSEFFGESAGERRNFIWNCGPRICFQSIRKLVDREATERTPVED